MQTGQIIAGDRRALAAGMASRTSGVVHKTLARSAGSDPLEYVMSDETPDRMGDIISVTGWQLANFQKNPIALFGHDPDFIVGKWSNVRVERGQLLGRLELLPAVSVRLTELHSAINAGVLRAVSVGFRPIEYETLEDDGDSFWASYRYTQSELVECSLVAVPANPNALEVSKALGLSGETIRAIFGEHAEENRLVNRSVSAGGNAVNPTRTGNGRMNTSQQIERQQARIAGLQHQAEGLLSTGTGPDGSLTAEQIAKLESINTEIATEQRSLEVLRQAERAIGGQSEMVAAERSPESVVSPGYPGSAAQRQSEARPSGGNGLRMPFAVPKRDLKPRDIMWRAITAATLAHIRKQPLMAVAEDLYGSDDSPTKAVAQWLCRAATVPANTTTSGWAAELVRTVYGDFFEALFPQGIYGPLTNQGLRLTLGPNGQIVLPTRNTTPTVAGAFVAEGAPIPVKQAALTSFTIGLKKAGVITTYSRELAEHSTPQIETLLRTMITDDTQVAIDSVLVDNNAATSIRPAGLRNGVSGLTPTAGGGFDALVADVKQLVGVLVGANSLRNPVWLMNPIQKLSISLTANAFGVFPFAAQVDQGRFQGFPIIDSTTVPAGTVILLDAADFVSITGDDPRFEVSDQAVLHMEDTTPLQISTTGAPNTVAAPVRSMFQTDSLALRMILPCNWAMRRAGVLAWVAGVTW